MLSIKGGHIGLRRRHSIDGNSPQPNAPSGANRRVKLQAQVHATEHLAEELVATGLTSTLDKHGRARQFAKRPTSSLRLLSIISLIVILTLSRQCSARPLATGLDAGVNGFNQDGASESFAIDRQQQQQQQVVDVGYVLEMGCRNLVEAMLHPQRVQPKDQRAAMDFMEFVDSERNKRLSPKHTPRFGR